MIKKKRYLIIPVLLLIYTGTIQNVRAVPADPQDSLALVAIYNATGGPGWTTTWNLNDPVDTWEGVSLSGSGKAFFLSLDNNNLIGDLPPEIGNLTSLEYLNLRFNQLTSIPPEIGLLSSLEDLNLSINLLTNLPPEIGNLTNLIELSVEDNQLTGIPPEIGNLNIEYLALSANQLTSLPPEIGNLSGLETLRLDHNLLSGLPPEIGNLAGSLKDLFLLGNNLTDLPAEFGNLSNLTELYLLENMFTDFPIEITDLANLKRLDLTANQIDTLPDEIINLTNLNRLFLGENQFTGIPDGIFNLGNLTDLAFNGNQITEIPPEISNLTMLENLYLSANKIASLPVEMLDLDHIRALTLSENLLADLPDGIENMDSIEWLTLNKNLLSSIPDFSGLKNISILAIRNNMLDFSNIIPNLGINFFTYSPQDSFPLYTNGSEFYTTISGTGYQWYHNFAPIAGATDSSYLPPTSGFYYCKVTHQDVPDLELVTEYCFSPSNVISSDQVVTMNQLPDHLTDNGTHSSQYAYQWQDSVTGSGWNDIPGADKKDFAPPIPSNTVYYRRKAASLCASFISNTVKICRYPDNIIGNAQTVQYSDVPEILQGPAFSDTDNYDYQWQDSISNEEWKNIPGATTSDFLPPSIFKNTWFRRIINTSCISDTSNSILICIDIESNIIINDQVINAGEIPVKITGLPPLGPPTFSYQWQDSVAGRSWESIANATNRDYQPQGLEESTYYRRLVSSSCAQDTSNTLIISVNPSADVDFSFSNTCAETPVAFINSSSITAGEIIGYSWDFGDGATSTEQNPVYIYQNPGTYQVQLRTIANSGITNSLTRSIEIYPLPDADAGEDVTISEGNSINLQGQGGTIYQWTPITGLSNPGIANPAASPDETTTYTLEVNSEQGCISSIDSVTVYVIQSLSINNIVTPNGDGFNDTWEITGIEFFGDNEVYVFNRWGKEMYREENYQNDWAATDSQGKKLPDGVYYYVVNIKGETSHKGALTIMSGR